MVENLPPVVAKVCGLLNVKDSSLLRFLTDTDIDKYCGKLIDKGSLEVEDLLAFRSYVISLRTVTDDRMVSSAVPFASGDDHTADDICVMSHILQVVQSIPIPDKKKYSGFKDGRSITLFISELSNEARINQLDAKSCWMLLQDSCSASVRTALLHHVEKKIGCAKWLVDYSVMVTTGVNFLCSTYADSGDPSAYEYKCVLLKQPSNENVVEYVDSFSDRTDLQLSGDVLPAFEDEIGVEDVLLPIKHDYGDLCVVNDGNNESRVINNDDCSPKQVVKFVHGTKRANSKIDVKIVSLSVFSRSTFTRYDDEVMVWYQNGWYRITAHKSFHMGLSEPVSCTHSCRAKASMKTRLDYSIQIESFLVNDKLCHTIPNLYCSYFYSVKGRKRHKLVLWLSTFYNIVEILMMKMIVQLKMMIMVLLIHLKVMVKSVLLFECSFFFSKGGRCCRGAHSIGYFQISANPKFSERN